MGEERWKKKRNREWEKKRNRGGETVSTQL